MLTAGPPACPRPSLRFLVPTTVSLPRVCGPWFCECSTTEPSLRPRPSHPRAPVPTVRTSHTRSLPTAAGPSSLFRSTAAKTPYPLGRSPSSPALETPVSGFRWWLLTHGTLCASPCPAQAVPSDRGPRGAVAQLATRSPTWLVWFVVERPTGQHPGRDQTAPVSRTRQSPGRSRGRGPCHADGGHAREPEAPAEARPGLRASEPGCRGPSPCFHPARAKSDLAK